VYANFLKGESNIMINLRSLPGFIGSWRYSLFTHLQLQRPKYHPSTITWPAPQPSIRS